MTPEKKKHLLVAGSVTAALLVTIGIVLAVTLSSSPNCRLIVDGENVTHAMFTKTGSWVQVKIDPPTADCDMKILAIGGGGDAWGAGGGSGYISYTTRTISTEEIRIYVGNQRQHTVVTLNDDEVRAEPGESGGDNNGGSGYSGGGAYCGSTDGCNGGYNGGDGEDGPEDRGGRGGRGTGEDVTQYKFDHYKLSPGDAGEGWKSSYGYYYGGGGGGVLINGVGPDRESTHQGQGYGGGGAGGGRYGSGLPGVVILEIVN